MSAEVLLTVGVVTFDADDELLEQCVRSVEQEAAALDGVVEIVLLDNASTRVPRLVREPAGRVRAVRSAQNLGFGRACNTLVAGARGTHVLLLNPDARLRPGALAVLLAAAAELHPALCGGWLVARGSVQVDAYRIWRTSWERRRTTTGWRAHLLAAQDRAVVDVPKVCGGALLARTDVLRGLGPFDERFFLYGEDADLSLRAAAAGVRTVVCPGAVVDHAAAASATAHGSLVERARVDATLRLNARHGPAWLSAWCRVELVAVTLAGCVAGGGSSVSRRARAARLRELARWRWRREPPPFTPG